VRGEGPRASSGPTRRSPCSRAARRSAATWCSPGRSITTRAADGAHPGGQRCRGWARDRARIRGRGL